MCNKRSGKGERVLEKAIIIELATFWLPAVATHAIDFSAVNCCHTLKIAPISNFRADFKSPSAQHNIHGFLDAICLNKSL